MSYGLKIYNSAGKSKTLTPDDGTIIAAGSKTMSNSLEGDNTYGEDVALGATYDEDEIGVLVIPRRPIYGVTYNRYIDTTLYYATFYLDSAKTYYTRNTSTGVMTSFTAGNKTVNSKSTWNPVLSVFPIAFWDKKGASTFSSVRLFAATTYLIRDPDNDTNLSLAGSASGSGGTTGTPSDTKDNNETSKYGAGCFVYTGNSCGWGYNVEINFGGTKNIFKVELVHGINAQTSNGNYANGSYAISLYYSSAWHSVLSDSWSDDILIASLTTSKTGHWKAVTKIKIVASGSAQAGYASEAISEHVTYELRAWGTTNTDDSENKIVYSIGNQGITTVDYMVCRKRFT